MAFTIGKFNVSLKAPFSLLLKTQQVVIADPIEGPLEVITCVTWLFVGISFPADPKHLAIAQKFWQDNSQIRTAALEQAKRYGYEPPKTH